MVSDIRPGTAVVYILRLQSGAFYVGCSEDARRRFADHAEAKACRTTTLDPPLAVALLEVHSNFASAMRREAQIKKWSRAKKAALIASDSLRLRGLSRSHEVSVKSAVRPTAAGPEQA
jgi:predicted GIY-YIG superfamily endonuclease